MNRRITVIVAAAAAVLGGTAAAVAVRTAGDSPRSTVSCLAGERYLPDVSQCLTVRYYGRDATDSELARLNTEDGWAIQILGSLFLFDNEADYRAVSGSLPPQHRFPIDITAAELERTYPSLTGLERRP